MKYYETLYFINPNLSDEEYRDIVTKLNALVEREKGVVVNVDEWGKKSLAYMVKKFDKGYYVLLQYCGEGGIVEVIERAMRLDERVLKYQTIKLSDHGDPKELKVKAEKYKKRASEQAEEGKEESPEEEEEGESEDFFEDDDDNGIQKDI